MLYRLALPSLMQAALIETFLDALPVSARSAWAGNPHLVTGLDALLTAATAAWPSLTLDPRDYFCHVASRCDEARVCDPKFHHLNGQDLYLAAACIRGNAAALIAFEESYLSQVPSMLSRIRHDSDLVEEVQQLLRERLLTASAGKWPGLEKYSGRGALLMWLRTVAIRTALNLLNETEHKRRARLEANTAALGAGAGNRDAQRVLVANRYGADVQAALLAAFAVLSEKQRTMVQMHYFDGQTLGTIGKVFSADKSTISRNIKAALRAIKDELRAQLRRELNLSPSDADSLVDTLISQLDLSLAEALSPTGGA